MAKTSSYKENGVNDFVSSRQTEIEQLRRDHARRKTRGYRILVPAVLLYVLAVSMAVGALPVGFYIDFRIKAVQLPFERHTREIGEIVAHFMLLFSSIPFCYGSKLVFTARRCFKKNAHLAVLEDTRKPVLYLRSFADDETQCSDFGLKWNEKTPHMKFNRVRNEDLLVKELSRCVGPVVAVGRPGETLPDLGAYRFYVPEDDWRNEIRRQIKNSRLVVLKTGITEGLRWELEQSLEMVSPDRIVLYCPQKSIPPDIQALVEERLGARPGQSVFVAFNSLGNASEFDTIEQVLSARSLFVQKGRMTRLMEFVVRLWDGQVLVRIILLPLFILVSAAFSGLIVAVIDPPFSGPVFWTSCVLFTVLLAIISFRLPLNRSKE